MLYLRICLGEHPAHYVFVLVMELKLPLFHSKDIIFFFIKEKSGNL